MRSVLCGLVCSLYDWDVIKEVRVKRLMCSVGEEAPQEIVDLMERCMQLDPEDRPDAAQCIEIISKYLRLHQAGSGKFRDAPMRTSSNDAYAFRRRSSQSSAVDTKSSAPRSGLSDQQRAQQPGSAEGGPPQAGPVDLWGPRSGSSGPRTPVSGQRSGVPGVLDVALPEEGPPAQEESPPGWQHQH